MIESAHLILCDTVDSVLCTAVCVSVNRITLISQ